MCVAVSIGSRAVAERGGCQARRAKDRMEGARWQWAEGGTTQGRIMGSNGPRGIRANGRRVTCRRPDKQRDIRHSSRGQLRLGPQDKAEATKAVQQHGELQPGKRKKSKGQTGYTTPGRATHIRGEVRHATGNFTRDNNAKVRRNIGGIAITRWAEDRRTV